MERRLTHTFMLFKVLVHNGLASERSGGIECNATKSIWSAGQRRSGKPQPLRLANARAASMMSLQGDTRKSSEPTPFLWQSSLAAFERVRSTDAHP